MPRKNGARTPTNPMPPLAEVLRDRQVLITGGTGFLGKVLLSILLRQHPEIGRILLLVRGDRRSSLVRYKREILDSPALGPVREHLGVEFERYMAGKVEIVPGDITEPGLISDNAGEVVNGSIDAVIHCAGLVNFEASLEKAIGINTIGAANVIEFCRLHGSALIHVSTCYTAGIADGQRFENDVPVEWCPIGGRNFNLQREIRDALAAIDRVEAESHDHARQEQFRSAAGEGNAGDGIDEPSDRAVESRRKQWLEERFKQIGKERAQSWGWPNTYSYTKSLGEQLVLAARDTITATVVRPSVIESAQFYPEPGWNQGVNTSAPLTYLTGRGFRFVPATGPLVLDVIPVDLVAHAIVPVLAAVLLKRHQPIYQLGTSDVNPLPMRRLVELTGLSNRRDHRLNGGPMGKLAPHLDATATSPQTYQLVTREIPAMLKQAASIGRMVFGDDSVPARKLEEQVEKIGKSAVMVRSLAEVYRPYTEDLVYTFHGKNIRDLYAALAPGDAERHPYHPEGIDWFDYWTKVHMPGLRRNIYPQLELHTRARPSGSFRYKTLIEMLDRAAEQWGARVALESLKPSGQRTELSYRELRDRSHRAGLLLGTRGVEPGDRVLLIAENSPEWAVAYFAIQYAGAVAVPLDYQVSDDELARIIRITEPRLALLSNTSSKRLSDAMSGIVEMELGDLQRPFVLRNQPALPTKIERKTLASIVFTSGTTGPPKGVMLTHGNFTAQIAALGRVFALGDEDVVLSVLPLHHAFEFTCGLLLPIASGARVVYPLETNAASLSRTLAEVKPTALIGVPAVWEAIHRRIVEKVEARGPFVQAAFDQLRELNRRLDGNHRLNLASWLFAPAQAALGGRLVLAVSGDAALPPRVAQFFCDIGIKLIESYGLTEAGPVLSIATPDEPLKPGSVGRQLAKVELKLARIDHQNPQAYPDPDQRHDQPDRIGEIMARGPNLMSGYYKDRDDATDAVLQEGWLRTGDLGRFDRDGILYILGRVKDVIADSNGERIYPDELEEHYRHSPYLREIAVVALDNQVAALAVPEYAKGKSRRTAEDKLREHFETVGASLSSHNRIEILRFTDADLPRTRTHKVKLTEVVKLLRETIESGDAARQATGTELEPKLPSYARFAEPYTIELPPPLRRLTEFAIRKTVGAALDSLLKPRVMGRGNVPANRNFIVVANQASHLDFALVSYALGNSGRDLVVLAAKDYFFNTNLRRFASTNFARLIPFDRNLAQIEALEAALAELGAGRSVLMFPEGTRSPDGAIHEFKSGVGYLAMHAGCDVLPIHLKGTFDVLGKGQLFPRRAPVEVRIGRVMTSDELRHLAQDAKGAGAYRKLADHIRKAVIELGEGGLRSNRRASIEAETSPLSEGGSQHEVSDVSRPRNRKSGSPAKG